MAKRVAARGSGRLTAEDAAGLTDRLLDAALALFSEEGYAGTRMDAIARRAGASTKTVYSRYTDKADILQAVVARTIDRIVSTYSSAMGVDPGDVEPHLFLTSLGMQISGALFAEGAGLNRLALSEAHRHPKLGNFYAAALAHGTGLIANVLELWKARGLLPKLKDVQLAATICLSILTDRARVFSALGIDLSEDERRRRIAFGVEVFLRAEGYEPAKKNTRTTAASRPRSRKP